MQTTDLEAKSLAETMLVYPIPQLCRLGSAERNKCAEVTRCKTPHRRLSTALNIETSQITT